MSNRKIVIVLAALLAVAGGITFVAWYRGSAHSHAAQANAEYFCPMHPTIVRDKPGECPICGMKLEREAASGWSSSTGIPWTRRSIPTNGRRTKWAWITYRYTRTKRRATRQ